MSRLIETVREVLAETTSDDMRVMAKDVIERIGRNERAEAFEDAVVLVVQKEMVYNRASTTKAIAKADDAQAGESRWQVAAGLYTRWLAQHETIHGVAKRRGDLSADEVLVCIENRRSTVTGAIRAMKEFEALHAAMIERKAKVLGDLPQDVLMAVIK